MNTPRPAPLLLFTLGLVLLNLGLLPAQAQAQTQSTQPQAQTKPCYVDGLQQQMQCGQIEVALDPHQPNGSRVKIHFAVLPAITPRYPQQAILAIAGGPGQSAIDVAPLFAQTLKQANQQRDIVLIDQRGTGRSAPLNCAELDSAFNLDDRGIDLANSQRKCVAEQTEDIQHFGSRNALYDFEAVRQHLGYAQWHLFAVSYGTRMAQLYLRHFPEALATATLDGVAPVSESLVAMGVNAAKALQRLFADCLQQNICQQAFPNLEAEYQQLLQRLQQQPERLAIRHPQSANSDELFVTDAKLLNTIRMSLYLPTSRALLPFAIHQAFIGDYQPLLGLMSILQSELNIAMGMHMAVICSEDWHRLTPEQNTQLRVNPMGQQLLNIYQKSCPAWPVERVAAEFAEPVRSNVPVLLLSGSLDPATPPAGAELVAQHLDNAKHIVAPNAGHGVAQQTCAKHIVAQFIEQRTPQQLDSSCLTQSMPRPFFINANGSAEQP